jgi:hypothetical protein
MACGEVEPRATSAPGFFPEAQGGELMADHGIFIGWGEVIAGRERQAEKVFGEAIAYFTGLQEKGTIESFEPVFLRPHGGDLSGCMLVRGDRDAMHEVLHSPEWERLSARTTAIVHGFGVVPASLGAETMRLVQANAGYTSDLT